MGFLLTMLLVGVLERQTGGWDVGGGKAVPDGGTWGVVGEMLLVNCNND